MILKDQNDDELTKEKSIIDNDADGNIAANLIPVSASLVDIFFHKFLVHNVALDSARRIQSCYERGKRQCERNHKKTPKKYEPTLYLNLAEELFLSTRETYGRLQLNAVDGSKAPN